MGRAEALCQYSFCGDVIDHYLGYVFKLHSMQIHRESYRINTAEIDRNNDLFCLRTQGHSMFSSFIVCKFIEKATELTLQK